MQRLGLNVRLCIEARRATRRVCSLLTVLTRACRANLHGTQSRADPLVSTTSRSGSWPSTILRVDVRADDGGGRKAASRMSQRVVALGPSDSARTAPLTCRVLLDRMIPSSGREVVPVPVAVEVAVLRLMPAVL